MFAGFNFRSNKAQEYKGEHHVPLFKERAGIASLTEYVATLKKDIVKI